MAETVVAPVKGSEPAQAPTPAKEQVVIVGQPGEVFNIKGPGLGDERGTLVIGNVAITPSRWSDRKIGGVLPKNAKGEVVLTLASGEVRRGVYPPKG